jgi:hypothetical protein
MPESGTYGSGGRSLMSVPAAIHAGYELEGILTPQAVVGKTRALSGQAVCFLVGTAAFGLDQRNPDAASDNLGQIRGT